MALLTFAEALRNTREGVRAHLLLGNGFSRALRNDIFDYKALFDRADFQNISQLARQVFDALNTRDFEVVMRALRTTAALVRIYRPDQPDLAQQLEGDAAALRDILVRAIAANHPEHPNEITVDQYRACRRFLSYFKNVYTFNYDLLLYWVVMQDLEPQIPSDDGFRRPEHDEDYVVWEPDVFDQSIFYLHGALHVFDAQTEVQKYTWLHTGVRLIEQVRNALENDLYPIFVAEGESDRKLERIRHSDFLTRSVRSFRAIGGTLFVHGHSLADNDDHVLRLIPRSPLRQLFVGIHGDEHSESNQRIMTKARTFAEQRSARKAALVVDFYDAASAAVWG